MAFLLALMRPLEAQETARPWTSQDGRTIQATLVDAGEDHARLRLANGSVATVPLSRFSEADQTYIRLWRRDHARPVPMPEFVGVDLAALKIAAEGEDASGVFHWRSPHFQIASQADLAASIIQEIVGCLEAVRALFQALPWDIQPAPPPEGRHKVTFFTSMAAYHAAGGPPGSAGVYHAEGRRLLMPLESLGLVTQNGRLARGADYKLDVLIHEQSHQMMHFWLKALPQWAIEGMAEYVRMLPYRNGRFHTKEALRGLKDHLEFRRTRVVGGLSAPYPIDKMLALSAQEWSDVVASGGQTVQSLYLTSYLLVYYFMHLDDAGDGMRFIRYLRTAATPAKQWETYENAMLEYRKSSKESRAGEETSIRPERPPRPHLPRDLLFGRAVEERHRQNLQILLDGRSEADLMNDVRAAYQRLGIQVMR